MKKIKHRMTEEQEFEFLKIVFDKFILLSSGLILAGMIMFGIPSINSMYGLTIFLSGIVLILIFVVMIMDHYEIVWD